MMRQPARVGMWVAWMVLGTTAGYADVGMRQAQVSSVQGQVEWLASGTEIWQAVSADQWLASGDKIRTGADGRLMLSLDEGSTLDLAPGSELVIQILAKDEAGEQLESVFGLWQGRLLAQVSPPRAGSTFQIETPAVTVSVPAGEADPTLLVTVNPDGSVSVRSDDGPVDLIREGDQRMRARLETGEEALVEYDPATGVLRVTSITGTFEVIGPDDHPITLASGDTVVFRGGAATFIPGTPPVQDTPAAETLGEPVT